jgi:hypothetical protein
MVTIETAEELVGHKWPSPKGEGRKRHLMGVFNSPWFAEDPSEGLKVDGSRED